MGKKAVKKRKQTKAERKRRRQIIQWSVYAGVLILGVACLLTLSRMGRASDGAANDWYVQNADVEIAAPAGDGAATLAGRSEGGDSALRVLPVVTETPTPKPTVTPTPAPTARTITITAAGDCTLGGSVHQDTYLNFKKYVQNYGYDYFFSNVRSYFESDDLTILNLEGPITDVGKDRHGSYVFKGDPDYVNIMTGSSVELCNLANNHSMDFGEKGFERTGELLDASGIGWCGYTKVFRTTIKGVRISALGYLEWEIGKHEIVKAVKAERPYCDILIVNMHWGREKHYEPMSVQKQYGHAIIDAGADLIIGTHPHVYGGVELYKGKYIAYSLGNFCFGGNANPTDKRCLMFRQTFVVSPDGQISDGGIDVIPCSVSSVSNLNDFRPTVMQQGQGVDLLGKVAQYSSLPKDETLWLSDSYSVQAGLVTTARIADAYESDDDDEIPFFGMMEG